MLLYTGQEYRTKWNPDKWNIADTHETFTLDNKFECDLVIKPHQEFSIEFFVYDQPKFGTVRVYLENDESGKSRIDRALVGPEEDIKQFVSYTHKKI